MPRTGGKGTVSQRRWGRAIALAAVLAIHLAFVMILTRSARPPVTTPAESSSLLLVDIVPTVEPSKEPSRTAAHRRRARSVGNDEQTSAEKIESQPTIGVEPPAAIDWFEQAARAAANTASRFTDSIGQCNEKGDPASKLPPCPARPGDFEWSPQKQRVGVDRGLLYFRPTERCVVGFGIAGLVGGCSIGKEEANGHLFDGMKSPDRPSSIPDIHDRRR